MLQNFFILFLSFLTIVSKVSGSSEKGEFYGKKSSDSKDENLKFFKSLPTLKLPVAPSETQSLVARFSIDPEIDEKNIDMILLQKCTNMNLLFASEDIKNYIITSGSGYKFKGDSGSINKKGISKQFVEGLMNTLNRKKTNLESNLKNNKNDTKAKSKSKSKEKSSKSNETDKISEDESKNPELEMTKFTNALNHVYCHQSIELCGFSGLGKEFTTLLVKEQPQIMKKHLKIVSSLDDFSFLTPEIALELFQDRNSIFTPFSLRVLVKSVNLEVLLALLELWEFELNKFDAKQVIDIWGKRQEFLNEIEKDPRSWLLWFKLDITKALPMEQLLKILNAEFRNIYKYTNLILAFLYEIEFVIFDCFIELELVFINLIKSKSENSNSNLDEWMEWRNSGQEQIKKISEQFELKNVIINFLDLIIGANESTENDKCFLRNICCIINFPIMYLSHNAFVRSKNQEIVSKAILNENNKSYSLLSKSFEIESWGEDRLDLWTIMWHQLGTYSAIGISYKVSHSLSDLSSDTKDFVATLESVSNSLSNEKSRLPCWHVFMTILSAAPTSNVEESNEFIKRIRNLIINYSSELKEKNINYIESILAPESVARNIKYYDVEFEKFKLAPETLSRDQIKKLIKNQEMREFMLIHSSKVMQLRTLIDFTTEDLLQFFPIFDSEFHLELHDALYTANPEALIGYLRGIEGSLNYPERFAWSVHPVIWNYSEFVDLMSDNIPFSLFVYYPNEVESLNLVFAVCDIMGRISRCNGNSLLIKKQIIKWVINMEWIFNQYQIFFKPNQSFYSKISIIYKNFAAYERFSRSNLVQYLKSSEGLIDLTKETASELLKIIELLPLSHFRLCSCVDAYLIDSVANLHEEKRAVKNQYFEDLSNQFTSFVGKKFTEIKISELDKQLNDHLGITKELIEKNFGLIEKIIWNNRLNVVNLVSVEEYTLNSDVTISLIHFMFKYNQAPIYNIQLAYQILFYLDYNVTNLSNCKGETFFLKSPQAIQQSMKRIQLHDDFMFKLKKSLAVYYLNLSQYKY